MAVQDYQSLERTVVVEELTYKTSPKNIFDNKVGFLGRLTFDAIPPCGKRSGPAI